MKPAAQHEANPYAPPQSELVPRRTRRTSAPKSPLVPAALWRRGIALTIDVAFVVTFGMGVEFVLSMLPDLLRGGPPANVSDNLHLIYLAGWLGFAFCYFWLMECSPLQATMGKRVVHIVVTDLEGRPIGLRRALGRNVAKIGSIAPCFVGVLWVLFNDRHQTLHDRLANTVVVKE